MDHMGSDTRRFDRGDLGRIEQSREYTQDLSVARTQADPLELFFTGDSLYLTDDTTGKIYIRFGSKEGARYPASSGFGINGVLFQRVFLDWTAQAGLQAHFLHALGVSVVPENDIGNIGSVGTITNQLPGFNVGLSHDHYYGTSAALVTLVTPAANVNGVRVNAGFVWNGGQASVYMIKTSAPASYNDSTAEVILRLEGGTATQALQNPILIPAGFGLYRQTSGANNKSAALSYEVL